MSATRTPSSCCGRRIEVKWICGNYRQHLRLQILIGYFVRKKLRQKQHKARLAAKHAAYLLSGHKKRFMKVKCPNCQTRIYSRAHKVCHTCGFALPPELLLPESQIRSIEGNGMRELKAELEADRNINTSGTGDMGAAGLM